ncbi:hypothetical protein DCCM_2971 [Desulfocucumis palustris]|uniref:Uncharacterized protein n=1 Tax=Desulfocucumis palustris TaxID=1898651 RepID=A0A2L2XCJ1_9FIRM|nr:hypothetical protein [Desulfocucumis palustris]GBF33860.1 hypothetical protein DCCM_2971 [Desulfocucumis palustris]
MDNLANIDTRSGNPFEELEMDNIGFIQRAAWRVSKISPETRWTILQELDSDNEAFYGSMLQEIIKDLSREEVDDVITFLKYLFQPGIAEIIFSTLQKFAGEKTEKVAAVGG